MANTWRSGQTQREIRREAERSRAFRPLIDAGYFRLVEAPYLAGQALLAIVVWFLTDGMTYVTTFLGIPYYVGALICGLQALHLIASLKTVTVEEPARIDLLGRPFYLPKPRTHVVPFLIFALVKTREEPKAREFQGDPNLLYGSSVAQQKSAAYGDIPIQELKQAYFGVRRYSVPWLDVTTKVLDDAVHVEWAITAPDNAHYENLTVEGFSKQGSFDGVESSAHQIVNSGARKDFKHHRILPNTTHYYLFRLKGRRRPRLFEDANADRTVILDNKITFSAHVPDKIEAVRQQLTVKELEQRAAGPAGREIERKRAEVARTEAILQEISNLDRLKKSAIAEVEKERLTPEEKAAKIAVINKIYDDLARRLIS